MRTAVIITFLVSSLMAFAANKTTEVFTLDHQMSQHCEKKIKENLRFEKGISKIEVSLPENTITITYNPDKTNTEKIIEGFKKIGFNAFVYGTEQKAESCCSSKPQQECCSSKQQEGCCGNQNLQNNCK